MKQITEEQAIKIYKSGCWKNWTPEKIVKVQLYQDRLCVPFDEFHKAIESVLGRPVYTHEFAWQDNIIQEYEGKRPTPSFEEIIALIPADKLIVVSA